MGELSHSKPQIITVDDTFFLSCVYFLVIIHKKRLICIQF